MRDQGGLNFGGADTVAGDVEHIIGTAKDGDVTMFVLERVISGDVGSLDLLPIALVACVVIPGGPHHVREWTIQNEASTHIDTDGLALGIDYVSGDSGEGDACLANAVRHGDRSAKRGTAKFSLPPVINYVTPFAVPREIGLRPAPCFWIERLS